MSGEDEKKADCYSDADRGFMVLTQKVRAKLFGPVIGALVRCGISADVLTFLSFLAGIGSCAAFFYSKPLALALLALHVLFDGLDGPVARRTGKASRRGSFTDTTTDQTVVAATTITLIYMGVIGVVPGAVYIFAYSVVIAFSMVRNALNIPYSWLVRPRYFIYLWFPVEFYLLPGTINWVLCVFTALLLVKMVTGFYRIRKRL